MERLGHLPITGDGAHLAQQCNQNNAMFHGSCWDMLLQCQRSVVAKRLNVTTAKQNQFPNRCFYLGSTDFNKTRHLTTKKHTSPWRIRKKMRLPDRKEPTEPRIEEMEIWNLSSPSSNQRGPHVKANIGQPPENGGLARICKEQCSTRIRYLNNKKAMYQPTSMTFCVPVLFAGAEKRSKTNCWRIKTEKTTD